MDEMPKKKSHKHVAVIIILIVIILGLSGYIIWQNFIKKDDLSSQEVTVAPATETTKPEDTTKELRKFTFNKGVGALT